MIVTPCVLRCRATKVLCRFRMRLELNQGDYFISLGLAERHDQDFAMLDARHDLLHLPVRCYETFGGLVGLQVNFEALSRGAIHGSAVLH